MHKFIVIAYAILILLSILSPALAFDENEAISDEQAKLFLLQRMGTISPDGSLIDAEGALYFAAIDTVIRTHLLYRFRFDSKQLWHFEKTSLLETSLNDGGIFYPIPDSIKWCISEKTLDDFAKLISYPFFITAKRFVGYNLEPRKKSTEINGIDCIKIAIKPNLDENLEKSPLTGSIYISNDRTHRIVRIEHHIKRSGVEQRVRWDFRNMGEFDFPYKITTSLETQMCGLDYSTVIRAYFPDINQLMPIDTSKSAPHINMTMPTK